MKQYKYFNLCPQAIQFYEAMKNILKIYVGIHDGGERMDVIHVVLESF